MAFWIVFSNNNSFGRYLFRIVLYHPNSRLNIFLVILSFFRPFRYGKNDLSRSRGILSPGAPVVSMVVYVVVKIRSQIEGFGLVGADCFISRICGQLLWSFYYRIHLPGLSYCNSFSTVCQEVKRLKFAPQ